MRANTSIKNKHIVSMKGGGSFVEGGSSVEGGSVREGGWKIHEMRSHIIQNR